MIVQHNEREQAYALRWIAPRSMRFVSSLGRGGSERRLDQRNCGPARFRELQRSARLTWLDRRSQRANPKPMQLVLLSAVKDAEYHEFILVADIKAIDNDDG